VGDTSTENSVPRTTATALGVVTWKEADGSSSLTTLLQVAPTSSLVSISVLIPAASLSSFSICSSELGSTSIVEPSK
jgi:hypothetical protein